VDFNSQSAFRNLQCLYNWWGGEVSNLRRLTPTDLQSVPFGHSGTSPKQIHAASNNNTLKNILKKDGATEGTRTPDRLITNQLLYQLSYGGRTLWTHHSPEIYLKKALYIARLWGKYDCHAQRIVIIRDYSYFCQEKRFLNQRVTNEGLL
jgi:hypothetical protein